MLRWNFARRRRILLGTILQTAKRLRQTSARLIAAAASVPAALAVMIIVREEMTRFATAHPNLVASDGRRYGHTGHPMPHVRRVRELGGGRKPGALSAGNVEAYSGHVTTPALMTPSTTARPTIASGFWPGGMLWSRLRAPNAAAPVRTRRWQTSECRDRRGEFEAS